MSKNDTTAARWVVVSTNKATGRAVAVGFANPIAAFEYFNSVAWNRASVHEVIEGRGTKRETVAACSEW